VVAVAAEQEHPPKKKAGQLFAELEAFAPRLPVRQRSRYLTKLRELETLLALRTKAASDKKLASNQPTRDAVASLAGPVLQKHRDWSSWAVAGRIEKEINAERQRPLSRHTIRDYVESYRVGLKSGSQIDHTAKSGMASEARIIHDVARDPDPQRAKRLGITQGQLSQVLRGIRRPSASFIKKAGYDPTPRYRKKIDH
jgi:hypothetical protein